MKAAIEFFRHTKIKQNIKIKIFKKIPIQAGLGGGSSNAATVLVGLNKLFKTNLSTQQLCKIATKVGADVPFLVVKKTALVGGLGDIVKPIKPLYLKNILIVKPKSLNIETKQAFKQYDLIINRNQLRNNKNIESIAKKIEQSKPFSSYCFELFNSFEETLNTKQNEQINQT